MLTDPIRNHRMPARLLPHKSSPMRIWENLRASLAILSQSGKIELSFHPIAETELTNHHIALQQMNMLRTLPCHLPRQIVTVSCSTCIILINGWYGTAKQEAALELRKQIESGIETYGTFSLKSNLAKKDYHQHNVFRHQYAECPEPECGCHGSGNSGGRRYPSQQMQSSSGNGLTNVSGCFRRVRTYQNDNDNNQTAHPTSI